MSSRWPMVPLGEVLTQYKEYIDAPEAKTYPKLSVKLYGKGVTLDTSTDGTDLKMKRHQLAKAGQVILSEIWGKKGAIGFVPPKGEGALCTSHFFLFDVNGEKLLPKWLECVFKANYLQEQLDLEAKGTTGYAAVRPVHLLKATIPLPPVEEQRRLVERIDALAAKLDEAKTLRQEANESLAAFISSFHSHLANGRTVKISDILELHEDRAPVEGGREYPQIGVKGFGEGLFPREALAAHQTTYKTFNRLYAGAVVLSQVKGWEGAIAVCPNELAGRFASPEYRTFRCKPDAVLPDYLAVIVPTPWFWRQLSGLTRGVGARRERIRPELFLDMQLPMPSLEDQQAAVLVFEQVQLARREQATIPEELDAILPAILHRAFSGEL